MARSSIDLGIVLTLLALASAGCSQSDESNSGSGNPSGSGGTSSTGGTSSGGTSSSGTGGGVTGGIAQKYPGDIGIGDDPDVIFADDFESYTDASKLWDRWDNTFQAAQTRIATEAGNVFAGKQAVEFTLPAQDKELSNAVQKVLTTELDALYLRWYSKFDSNFDVVGSSHNGGGISAHYFIGNQATPGIPADGKNKFLTEFEHWRGEAATKSPGQMNVYIYHPEQRDNYGDHFFPSGLVLPNTSIPYDFGPDFKPQPEVIPELDHWYCYEYMVKANTPGQRDGRITLWVDGKQIADFGNLRLRDIDTLKIDRFNLSLHARNTPKETKKYYDNVVAAKSYIGPMVKP
jgi:hypothetical protein